MMDKELEILQSINAERDRELWRMIDMLHAVTKIATNLSPEKFANYEDLVQNIHDHGRQTENSQHEFSLAWDKAKSAEERLRLTAHRAAIMGGRN